MTADEVLRYSALMASVLRSERFQYGYNLTSASQDAREKRHESKLFLKPEYLQLLRKEVLNRSLALADCTGHEAKRT